jgi:hypothetical protein
MMRAVKRKARQAWLTMFSQHPYEYVARAAWLGAIARMLPRSYVADIERGLFTGRGGLMGAIVRGELERRYYASPPSDQQQRIRDLWGGEAGRAWHANRQALYVDRERFERELLRTRQPLVDALSDLLTRDPRYQTICEIGTGNGMFLRYLRERWAGSRRYVGIDLSTAQIEANRNAYRDTGLEFQSIEAIDWIDGKCSAGTVFIACGTLECLTGPELCALLARVASIPRPAAFGIVEPVNMDLERELESRPRGAMTFSHNYPRAFEAAGFRLLDTQRIPIDSRVKHYDLVILLAESGA